MSETQFFPIATVTQQPAVANVRIERTILLDELDRSEARVIVIKAPAGFGKTTLAADWSHRLKAGGARVAWLRASDELNEPGAFLFYLCTTVEKACPGAGRAALDLLQFRDLPPAKAVAAVLINALVENGDEVVLFIDDFEQVTNPDISDFVWFLVRNAPFHFRVVITTREEPGFPMGEGQVSGDVLEIDARQLRFSLDEAERLFRQKTDEPCSEELLQLIHRRTGGWPAGMRIILSSAAHPGIPIAEVLERPEVGERALHNYMAESIRRLPSDVSHFMVVSCLMGAIDEAKCNYVLEVDAAREMIELLYHRFQLLVRDREGNYRYSRVVATFLEVLAKKMPAEAYRGYQRRAADWCQQNGHAVDAIRHAIEAGELELAAGWIERCGMQLVKEGSIRDVLGWMQWIPEQLMRGQLKLRLAIGWSLALSPKRSNTFAWLDAIEADARLQASAVLEDILRECRAIRAAAYAFSDLPDPAEVYVNQYQASPLADGWTNNAVGNAARYCNFENGRHERVEREAWFPMGESAYPHGGPVSIYRHVVLGLSLAVRLRFVDAEKCFLQAREAASAYGRPTSAVSGMAEALLATLAYERNQLEVAERLIESRMDSLSASGFCQCVMRAYTTLTRIAVAQGDFTLAHKLLDRGEQVAAEEKWPRLKAAIVLERLRLAREDGDEARLLTMLSELEGIARSPVADGMMIRGFLNGYLCEGRGLAWSHQGRYEEAIASYGKALDAARHVNNGYFAARVMAMLAATEYEMGAHDAALLRFRELVTMTAPAGMIRGITDCGGDIAGLVRLATNSECAWAGAPETRSYLDRLQHVVGGEQGERHGASKGWVAGPSILAPRETEVLEQMALGLSNKRIAINMSVSPETVKWYVKSIFVKLGVDNRMRAVTEGRRRNLLHEGGNEEFGSTG